MTITINVKSKETQAKSKLDIRRDLAGNYVIGDHIDMDIVYKVSEGKILLFPKNDSKDSDVVYNSQDRFFEFMTKAGIIDPDSTKGASMIGVMQTEVLQNNSTGNVGQIVIYCIAQFIESERSYFRFQEKSKDDEMERLFDPDDEYSTELGEVPQRAKKGTIDPNHSGGGGYTFRMFEGKSVTVFNNMILLTTNGKEYSVFLKEPSLCENIKNTFQGTDMFLKTVMLENLVKGRYGKVKAGNLSGKK
jgi:hypothetical protein